MSFAQPQDFVNRYDERSLGDLVEDNGQNVGYPAILSDPNLQIALNDAAGEIVAAVIPNGRYTTTILYQIAASGLPSSFLLIKLNCARALVGLFGRRCYNQEEAERRIPDYKWGEDLMEKLRNGIAVFELPAANAQSGVMSNQQLGQNIPLLGHNRAIYGITQVNYGG